MQAEIQKLNEQLRGLKVRVFDAEEALSANNKSFTEVMQKLVDTMKVQGDDNGGVTVDAIVARAAELIERENAYFSCQPKPEAVEQTYDVVVPPAPVAPVAP